MNARTVCVGLVVSCLAVTGCASTIEQHRLTLEDVEPELGREYEGQHQFNALHPTHLRSGRTPRLTWVDLCQTKECDGPAMRYTLLSREVAVTTGLVMQFDFVVAQIEAGELSAREAEPFLELGWDRLATLEDQINAQWREVGRLSPEDDFRRGPMRSQAEQALVGAYEQLRAARTTLDGLDEAISELYRDLEPRYACEESEPSSQIVLTRSDVVEQFVPVVRAWLEERGTDRPNDSEVVTFLVERGIEAFEAERRAQKAELVGPVVVEDLKLEGPLAAGLIHDWVDDHADTLVGCLPETEPGPLPLQVSGKYSSDGVVYEVRVERDADDDIATCVAQTMRGTSVTPTTSDLTPGGTLQVQVVLRKLPSSAVSPPPWQRVDVDEKTDDL